MNQFLNQLFGLDQSLSFGAEGVEFRFAREFPAWAWAGVGMVCFGIAMWSYWRLIGSRRVRICLGLMRGLLLLLIGVLLAGPELVRQNERVEKDWVVVMADRSASMGVADVPPEVPGGSPRTREAQLEEAMRVGSGAFKALAEKRNVLFMGFESGAFDLRAQAPERGAPAVVDLGEATGRRTFLGQSLEQALRRVAARPVAGVVLLTDGRSADAPSRTLLRQFESRRIGVYPVALGSAKPLPDLAVTRVEAPTAAFVNDIVPVNVEIDRLGANEQTPPATGKVQLVDVATGLVLDERPLAGAERPAAPGESPARITLMAKPDQAGLAAWTVRIVSEDPDLTPDNNSQDVHLEIADRPIRVAYFDGYPRWEYRYVKSILTRESSIKSVVMLLASDRRYQQDGSEILDALPRSLPEWERFDVIVIGDMKPELFSSEQLTQIRRLVSERGAGLLWIGGGGATPGAWRGTPLADLIPFALTGGETGGRVGPQAWLNPVLLKPGRAAQRYGVLQLTTSAEDPWPAELSEEKLGWPLLRWVQKLEAGTIKPTAETLAIAQPIEGPDSASPAPAVLTMRYGAGRVVYVATDETWRYRYARGEVLTERFWIPLVRLLARESLGRSGKPALLTAAPDLAQVNQQVQISLRLLDQTLIEKRPAGLTVRVRPALPAGEAGGATEVKLLPQATTDADEIATTFTGSWLGLQPGQYMVESADPVLAGQELSARVEIILPDDELRFPQTDHAGLEHLAQATGGQMLTAQRLSELPTLLPNRELRTIGTPDIETLWDKPFVWVVLISVMALEWMGRRLIKLS